MSRRNFDRPRFVEYLTAAPGYFVLGVLSDEAGMPFEPIQYPVVAWALEEFSLAPYPITMDGVRTDNVHILQPDGSVELPGIGGYASIDEWMAAQRQGSKAVQP